MLILSKYLYRYEVPATVLMTAMALNVDAGSASNDGWLNDSTEVARYATEQEFALATLEAQFPYQPNRLAAALGSLTCTTRS